MDNEPIKNKPNLCHRYQTQFQTQKILQQQTVTSPNIEQEIEDLPRVSFEKTVHNFGELGIGEKGQCEFRFKNTGTALLKIGKITVSCGCTVPILYKKQYQPGQEGVIKVNYKGKGKPGV